MSKDQTNAEEGRVKKKLQTKTPMSTDCFLPPFDPSNPVGMTLFSMSAIMCSLLCSSVFFLHVCLQCLTI